MWLRSLPLLPVLLLVALHPLSSDASCATTPCFNSPISCTDVQGGGVLCECSAGWTGARCLDKLDECASSPCQNGASCYDGFRRFTCQCTVGFAGDACEVNIDECASTPCFHQGTCIDGIDGYSCQCLTGFSGLRCLENIKECASSPCALGSTCVDQIGTYQCICSFGFEGHDCTQQIDWCASSPCLNGALCNGTATPIGCTCLEGFTGLTCESEIDACISSPCQNAATCVRNLGAYTCACADNFSGVLCELELDACSSSPCTMGSTCMLVGSTGLTCLCPATQYGLRCEEVTVDGFIKGYVDSMVHTPIETLSVAESLLRATLQPQLLDDTAIDESVRILKTLVDAATAESATPEGLSLNTAQILVDILGNMMEVGFVNRTQTPPEGASMLERLVLAYLGDGCPVNTTLSSASNNVFGSAFALSASDLATSGGLSFTYGNTRFDYPAELVPLLTSSQSLTNVTGATENCTRIYFNVLEQASFFRPSDDAEGLTLISSPVISTGLDMGLHDLQGNFVQYTVTFSTPADPADVPFLQCVAWVPSPVSVWSNAGCEVHTASTTQLECRCSHLTNFAVLLDTRGSLKGSEAISVASYVGSAICIAACAAVIVLYLLAGRKFITPPFRVVLLLCGSIVATQIMFIITTAASSSLSRAGCNIMGLFLHYSLLWQICVLVIVAFNMWMMIARLKKISDSIYRWEIVLMLVIPLVVIVLYLIGAAAANGDGPYNPYSTRTDTTTAGAICFLPTAEAIGIAFLMPLCLMVLLNMTVFLLVAHSVYSVRANIRRSSASSANDIRAMSGGSQGDVKKKSKAERALSTASRKSNTSTSMRTGDRQKSLLRVYISVGICLGFSWLFGVLTVATNSLAMAWLFVIANALQGIALFVNYGMVPNVYHAARSTLQSSHDTTSTYAGNSSTASNTRRSNPAIQTPSRTQSIASSAHDTEYISALRDLEQQNAKAELDEIAARRKDSQMSSVSGQSYESSHEAVSDRKDSSAWTEDVSIHFSLGEAVRPGASPVTTTPISKSNSGSLPRLTKKKFSSKPQLSTAPASISGTPIASATVRRPSVTFREPSETAYRGVDIDFVDTEDDTEEEQEDDGVRRKRAATGVLNTSEV